MTMTTLGLSLVALNLLTLRWDYLGDQTSLSGYGYPVPWFAFSNVSLMEYDVAVPGLLLNLLTNFLILYFALQKLTPKAVVKRGWLLTALGLTLFSIGYFLFLTSAFKMNLQMNPLFEEGWNLESVSLHYGLDRPYRI
jgi:hypothetical protein